MPTTKEELVTGIKKPKFKILCNGGFGTGKCVSGDTLISGADGRIHTIEEIYHWKRFSILAFDGNYLKAIEPNNFIKKFSDSTIELKTCSGMKVRGTPEHPILTVDGWKRLDEISVEDEVFTASNLSEFQGKEDTLSDEFCELLGYIIGDGNITQQRTTLTIHDFKIVAHVKQLCEKLGYEFVKTKSTNRCSAYTIKNENLKERLIDLGLWGRTSHTKKVPAELFKQTNKKIAKFLNGLFTCDGTIYAMRRKDRPIGSTIYGLSYCTVNERLAREVGLLLSRFDIPYSIRERKVKYKNEYDHKAFEVNIARWQGKKTFCELIGMEKAKNLQEIVRKKELDSVTMTIFDSHCVKDKVKSINKREGTWVYDISVPELHNYLANGIVCHNTYFAMTFPKWAYAMIEPNGIMTAMSNPPLLENMIHYEEFVPAKLDLKLCFENLSNYLAKVKKEAEEGKIDTFILDNLSHLSENRWLYIEQYEPAISKSGKIDKLAQYGNLGRWLYKFILCEVIALPCHVVVNVHTQDEIEEEETDRGEAKRKKTGAIITNTLGGFRNDAAGLFNANIFLEAQQLPQAQYKYKAFCKSTTKYPAAKNNVGLPQLVENISFQTLVESITKK